jgi:hypothetical protein
MPPARRLGHLDESRLRYLAGKAVRHVRWARTEGLARLVEEDRLNPRERFTTARNKARWRRLHRVPPGAARPVYVVGLQRSGTNMLLRGVDQAPEVEVRNENDRRVFFRYRLRSEEVLASVVRRSRHAIVLVKPLCESHLVDRLLDLPGLPAGRAVWVYRDYVSRARSEVSKFQDANLQALRVIADGGADTIWQGQRLPAESVELVRSFDPGSLSPEAAAVLFWVVRNRLFFDLGLDRRDDVILVSYNEFVRSPEDQMKRLCAFIGLAYRPALCAHVEPRESHGTGGLDLDPRLVELADEVTARLAGAAARPGPPLGGDQPMTAPGLA